MSFAMRLTSSGWFLIPHGLCTSALRCLGALKLVQSGVTCSGAGEVHSKFGSAFGECIPDVVCTSRSTVRVALFISFLSAMMTSFGLSADAVLRFLGLAIDPDVGAMDAHARPVPDRWRWLHGSLFPLVCSHCSATGRREIDDLSRTTDWIHCPGEQAWWRMKSNARISRCMLRAPPQSLLLF